MFSRRPCRYYAAPFAAHCEDNAYDPVRMGADRQYPMFVGSRAVILKVRLLKCYRSLVKRDAMLIDILTGLVRIPFELRQLI